MDSKPTIRLVNATHYNKEVVQFIFPRKVELIAAIRQLPEVRWSKTMVCWYQPKKIFNLNKTFDLLKPLAWLDYSDLKKENIPIPHPEDKQKKSRVLPDGYLEKLQQRRYSKHTIKTYISYMSDFVKAMGDRILSDITPDEINEYILALIKRKEMSISQQNQRINAIKFYYEKVLDGHLPYFSIDRPRKETKLPTVLSKNEILKF